MQIQSQIKSNRMDIQNREQQIRQLEAKIGELQSHLGGTPAVQAEMMNLTRDYQTTQKGYVDLLDKKNASALATNLQRQQQGENFRIIDPPSLPEKASFPDRFKFSLAGLAVGLGLAVLFGAGSEYVDDRIRSEQDLADATPLPILVEIPPIRTDHEIASARRTAAYRVGGSDSGGDHYPLRNLLRVFLGIAHVQAILWADAQSL